ncbi:MAG: hypothetical protein F4Z57_11250 [Gemmatimonadetes bacterium]|nr:hypothetical protein [Gemmatimonadota bacterium]MYC73702.1 hypothetical protein [Gemmatimonadota bacterium]MYI62171.1 hypothetical protein [Gemmatimonadota bacterium]
MSSNDIVNRIVAEFRKVEREAPALGRPDWTIEVKTILCKLGRELGYTTWATGVLADYCDGKEFLYDASWLVIDNCERTISCLMVAECEWDNLGEVEYDFQKLLLARSKVRVMVYDAGPANEEYQEEICDRLREHVGTFNGTEGDTYLLIGWLHENTEKGFRFQFHRITDEGPGNPPKLKRL